MYHILQKKDQKYSEYIFKLLTKFTYWKNNGSLNLGNKILTGFDVDGRYLQGLALLGLGGIELGPISLNTNQKDSHMGLLFVQANIYTMMQKNGLVPQKTTEREDKNREDFKIGLRLVPDREIIELAPYLIPENLLNSLKLIVGREKEEPIKSETDQKASSQQTPTQESVIIKQKLPKLINFVTVDSEQIFSVLGQQNKSYVAKMLNDMFKSMINQVGRPQNLQIYEIFNNTHKIVYEPNKKQSQIKMEFITWKDIVNQIIQQ